MDEKSRVCIPFILDRLAAHQALHSRPFFIGLNGIQGAGKTTLVTDLHEKLSSPPHGLRVLSVSIDDLYLTNAAQRALAQANPANPLLQHRGQPGTHDLPAAKSLFNALRERKSDVKIPSYDKSLFNGQGDRAPEDRWKVVNKTGKGTIDVVLLEGWCVGFRPLLDTELSRKWQAAVKRICEEDATHVAAPEDAERRKGKLGRQKLDSIKTVNESLRHYDTLTELVRAAREAPGDIGADVQPSQFDAFIHIDASDIDCVYKWRLEQEEGLRKSKGSGMTEAQVVHFVNGYYPAYELFTDQLRGGIFAEKGRHLRFLVGPEREVIESDVL